MTDAIVCPSCGLVFADTAEVRKENMTVTTINMLSAGVEEPEEMAHNLYVYCGVADMKCNLENIDKKEVE